MTMSDPLGDLLTRIRNGQRANLSVVSSPSSKLRKSLLDVLTREGYIRGYTMTKDGSFDQINVELKYHDGEPVIKNIKRVSKPGRRVYKKIDELPQIYNGLGMSILSTPSGVLSENEARDANSGGEVLCEIF